MIVFFIGLGKGTIMGMVWGEILPTKQPYICILKRFIESIS